MLTSIDVKFSSSFAYFSASSGEKGMISSADILQIVNIFGRVVRVFLLFLVAILVLLSRNNGNLDSRASELPSIIFTFMLYLYWCHFPYIAKRPPNLVNAKWLWRISLGIWANQKPRTTSWADKWNYGIPNNNDLEKIQEKLWDWLRYSERWRLSIVPKIS